MGDFSIIESPEPSSDSLLPQLPRTPGRCRSFGSLHRSEISKFYPRTVDLVRRISLIKFDRLSPYLRPGRTGSSVSREW